MRRVWLAAGLGVAVLLAGLVFAGTRHSSPVAYANNIAPSSGIDLRHGQRACQGHEYVPPGSRKITLFVATGPRGGGPLELSVAHAGTVLLRGRTAPHFSTSAVTTALSGTPDEIRDATVCVRNLGRAELSPLGSAVAPLSPEATRANRLFNALRSDAPALIDGRQPAVPNRLSIAWTRPPRTWFAFAPTLALRESLFRPAFVGSWTFWLLLAGLLGTAVAAVGLMARESRA